MPDTLNPHPRPDVEHRLLTVRQPWARPIVDGLKTVENRSGGFTLKHRGHLWIHAGADWSDRGLASHLIHRLYPDTIQAIDPAAHRPLPPTGFAAAGWTRAAVIGSVEVVDAHHAEPGCCATPWAETSYVDARGRLRTDVVHLELDNHHRLPEPIRGVAGRLGLWRPDPDLAHELDLALAHQARP